MNKLQRTVAVVLTLITIAMAAFPPYAIYGRDKIHVGYGPIWSGPLNYDGYSEAAVDLQGLLLQVGGLWLIGGIFFTALRSKDS